MYSKCYSTLTHDKLIVCCVSAACIHSNTNVYSRAAFLFFGGLMCCQRSREKLSGFGWLTRSTMSLWSLVKKARAATFFWLKIRALVNVSICMFCPCSGKFRVICLLHTRWKSGTPAKAIRKVAIYDLIHSIKWNKKSIFSEALYVQHPTK